MKDKKHEGTVCWFDSKKGYGFISREKENDLFVHYSDIVSEGYKALKKGQRVSFGIGVNNRNDPKATEVIVID
jgi:CspA family cold shock protein